MSSGSFKTVIFKMCLEIIYLIYIYKEDLALNNLQWLTCHKTKRNQTKPNIFCLTIRPSTFLCVAAVTLAQSPNNVNHSLHQV